MMKSEEDYTTSLSALTNADILSQILLEVKEIRTCMTARLTELEVKTALLMHTCTSINEKLDNLAKNIDVLQEIHEVDASDQLNVDTQISRGISDSLSTDTQQVSKGNMPYFIDEDSKIRVVPLSTEADYPCGSWLGDPKCHTRRVRTAITPQQLLHINTTCFTAEKLAITLMDFLFTKEELASSNISGRGLHDKQQLDPLKVFGICCHLQYLFNINEKEWKRICKNIDAKCRFNYKRKLVAEKNGKSGKMNKSRVVPLSEPKVKSESESQVCPEDITYTLDELSQIKVIPQPSYKVRVLSANPGADEILSDAYRRKKSADSDGKKSFIKNGLKCPLLNGEFNGSFRMAHIPGDEKSDMRQHKTSESNEVNSALDKHSNFVEIVEPDQPERGDSVTTVVLKAGDIEPLESTSIEEMTAGVSHLERDMSDIEEDVTHLQTTIHGSIQHTGMPD